MSEISDAKDKFLKAAELAYSLTHELGHFSTESGVIRSLPQLISDGESGVDGAGRRMINAVGNGIYDDTDLLESLFSSEQPILGKPGSVYRITRTIEVIDKNIDIDLNGATILDDTPTGQAIRFSASFGPVKSILAIGKTNTEGGTSVSILTLSSIDEIKVGYVVKIFSNDIINPKANKPRERTAEYLKVINVNHSQKTITLDDGLIFEHNSNPRLACLNNDVKLSLKNFYFDSDDLTRSGFPYYLMVNGYVKPRYFNIFADKGTGGLLFNRNCFGAVGVGVGANWLPDNPEGAQYGYGVVDYGSQHSQWFNLDFGHNRHCYTTGADDVSADDPRPELYGGAVRCHVFSGVSRESSNPAWDTHEDSYETTFHHIVAKSCSRDRVPSTGGFQDRGMFTHVINLSVQGTNSDSHGVVLNNGTTGLQVDNLINHGSGKSIVNFATHEYHAIIKNLDYHVTHKYMPRLLQCSSDKASINIEKANIYFTAKTGNYISNGSNIFNVGGGSFVCRELNIYARGMINDMSGSYELVSLDSNCKRVEINLRAHVDAKSYATIGCPKLINCSQDGGVTVYDVERGEISVKIYSDDVMSGNLYNQAIETFLPENSNIMFSIETDGDGLFQSLTAHGSEVIYDGNKEITWGYSDYPFIKPYRVSDKVLTKVIESHSGTVSRIKVIAPPSFRGQKATIFNPVETALGQGYPITIDASSEQLTLSSDIELQAGSYIELIGWKEPISGALKWLVSK